jgi:hypothetical protein
MKKNRYPTPDAIAQTIRHPGASMTGARRFYGSAGVAIYADERAGLANVASRVWLGPNITRRLSTYLDIVTPGVGGLIMQPAGVQPAQIDGVGPQAASARLREMAEAKHQVPVGLHKATLCSVEDSPDTQWQWSGLLAYDHQYRLKSGQYTTSRPMATFHVRGDAHPTRAHVLVEIHHTEDLDRVRAWIAALLPSAERWSVVPFALLDDRHAEIRAVVAAVGNGGEVTVANPRTRKAHVSSGDSELVEFVRHMKEARYTTANQGLESLIERAESVDHAILSAFDLYHWHGDGKNRVATRIRLKQAGMDPLTLMFGGAREIYTSSGMPLSQPIDLDAAGWDSLTSAAWDDDRKMAHLRLLWSRIIDSLQSSASSQAA